MPHLSLWNQILWHHAAALRPDGGSSHRNARLQLCWVNSLQLHITRANVESAEENHKHAALLWGLILLAEMCSYARRALNCNERVFSLTLLEGYRHILCFLRASWYSLELISSHLFVLRYCERIMAGGRRVQNTTAKLSHHFTMP